MLALVVQTSVTVYSQVDLRLRGNPPNYFQFTTEEINSLISSS